MDDDIKKQIQDIYRGSGLDVVQRELDRLKLPSLYEEINRLKLPAVEGTFGHPKSILDLAGIDQSRELRAIMEAATGMNAEYERITRHLGAIQFPELKSIALDPHFMEAQRALEAISAGFHHDAILPTIDAISVMSRDIASLVKPHSRFHERIVWGDYLDLHMRAIDQAWVLPDYMDRSALAFGQLARFGDVVRIDEPYIADTQTQVAEELGEIIEGEYEEQPEAREARYDDAGRNPALVAFPEEAYGSVVIAAGFELVLPTANVPLPVENGETVGSMMFDGRYNALLSQIEQHLRQFIEASLAAIAGSDWMRSRVHPILVEQWVLRQDADRKKGEPVFALIQYADFMDLVSIMTAKANWRDAFGTVFREKEWLQTSMKRLHPIRLRLAHARPLSQTDVLCLMTEGIMLMRAIGVMSRLQ